MISKILNLIHRLLHLTKNSAKLTTIEEAKQKVFSRIKME